MAPSIEFRVLGPVEAIVDDRSVDLGGPRTQALLVALLLRRDTLVTADRPVDDVWGEEPPSTAQSALQGHVSKLRRVLGPSLIETIGAGYRLPARGARG